MSLTVRRARAAAVSVVLALAGCGGGGGGTAGPDVRPKGAAYDERAAAACPDARLPRAATWEEVQRVLPRAGEHAEGALRRLRALEPPGERRAQHEQSVEALERFLEKAPEAERALLARDAPALQELAREVRVQDVVLRTASAGGPGSPCAVLLHAIAERLARPSYADDIQRLDNHIAKSFRDLRRDMPPDVLRADGIVVARSARAFAEVHHPQEVAAEHAELADAALTWARRLQVPDPGRLTPRDGHARRARRALVGLRAALARD